LAELVQNSEPKTDRIGSWARRPNVATIEVRQTDRESVVTTVEGAGLAIADWPLTFGLRFKRCLHYHMCDECLHCRTCTSYMYDSV